MSRRSLLASLLFICFLGSSMAQDIIQLENRAKIEAKDIVIKGKSVFYKDYGDNSGQEYSVDVRKVTSIRYANGEIIDGKDLELKTNTHYVLGNNLLNFHMLDFVVSNFTMSYERIFGDGKYSMQVPVSLGYGDPNDEIYLPLPWDSDWSNRFANRFSAGLNFNIFPTRQGKVRYFFGPGIQYASGVYGDGYDYSSVYQEYNTGALSFMVNNGFMVTPIPQFSFSLVGSIGARHLFEVEDGKTITTAKLSLNLSYRF